MHGWGRAENIFFGQCENCSSPFFSDHSILRLSAWLNSVRFLICPSKNERLLSFVWCNKLKVRLVKYKNVNTCFPLFMPQIAIKYECKGLKKPPASSSNYFLHSFLTCCPHKCCYCDVQVFGNSPPPSNREVVLIMQMHSWHRVL